MSNPNEQQIEFWNSDEAGHWVRDQDRYDAMLAPFTDVVLDAASLAPAARVIDVGCGTGYTTRAAARLAPDGHTTGIDISEPMIAAARRSAAAEAVGNVTFSVADAQTTDFSPEADVIVSRFGVMFFDDPVAAFTNLRSALADRGRIAFACWQPMLDNEWMSVPLMAVLAHVAPSAPPDPDAPGPFALGDRDRVVRILTAAGFRDVAVEPYTTPILVGGPGTVEDAVRFMRSTGMGRILLADTSSADVRAAIDAIGEALTPHADADGVRLGAATWIVTASGIG